MCFDWRIDCEGKLEPSVDIVPLLIHSMAPVSRAMPSSSIRICEHAKVEVECAELNPYVEILRDVKAWAVADVLERRDLGEADR